MQQELVVMRQFNPQERKQLPGIFADVVSDVNPKVLTLLEQALENGMSCYTTDKTFMLSTYVLQMKQFDFDY
jgi:hypothetical protein